jgi:3-methyl-2-oxobutanoate hydroxymethyltransferase
MSKSQKGTRLTVRDIQAMRSRGERIAVLTAYDFVTAALLDASGVDILLVGDSLGNVVLGYDTTLPVTLDDMARHAAAVVRGSQRALVVCDLPFGCTTTEQAALEASIRLLKETGCQAVKLEGGRKAVGAVRRLVEEGIPVMAHVGLTPQSVHALGGYYTHGKTEEEALELAEAACRLEEAGAFAIVLECVAEPTAANITRALTIPTIGIGSGSVCAGEVLVVNDLIGLNVVPPPRFARPRADVASAIRAAAEEYLREVKGTAQH